MKTIRLLFIGAFLCISTFLHAQGIWETYNYEVIGTQMLRTGNIMQNFIEDGAGNLFISSTQGGIVKYSETGWDFYDILRISVFGQSQLGAIVNMKTGIYSNWESVLDGNGKWIWFASMKGAVLWDGERILEMTGALDDNQKMIFHSDDTKEKFIIQDHQIMKYEGSKEINTKHSVVQNNCIFLDSKNRVWIGNYTGTLICLDDGVWKEYNYFKEVALEKESKFRKRKINSIIESGDGMIWVLGNSFVGTYDGENFNVERILNFGKSMYLDKNNVIWIAYDKGILSNDKGTWKVYERPEDKGMKFIEHESKFMEDSKGNLWHSSKVVMAARKGGGLYKLEGGEWIDYTEGKYHTDVLEDSNGNIWNCNMKSIYLMKDGTWEHQRTSSGFATFYYELYEDMQGNIWAGTSTVTGYIEKLKFD